MKRNDKIQVAVCSVLLLVFFSLQIAIVSGTAAIPTVENQKEALYAASIPPLPAAKEGSININTADAATLDTLPNIGEVLAGRIIAYREENGDFPHPACIMEVSGIGEKTYEKIRDHIRVTD